MHAESTAGQKASWHAQVDIETRESKWLASIRGALDLIGDVAKLAPEELVKLKQAYVQAVEDVEAIAAHGKGLGMHDAEVEAFMHLKTETPDLTRNDILKRMQKWNEKTNQRREVNR